RAGGGGSGARRGKNRPASPGGRTARPGPRRSRSRSPSGTALRPCALLSPAGPAASHTPIPRSPGADRSPWWVRAMPPFYADLHIHSKFSRACSRDCDLEHLALVGRRKGISVIGTGDFTHPRWFEELSSTLVPAEPGLSRLRPAIERSVTERLPASCRGPVRFMLSVEISTIYKRAERTRKGHHLLYTPPLEA